MPHSKKKILLRIPKIRPIGITGIRLDWSIGNLCKIGGSVRGIIRFFGKRNRVELGDGAIYTGHMLIRGSDNVIIIGPDCNITAKIIIKGDRQTVSIGEQTTFQSGKILCQENCDVSIGRACMISRDVEIRTSDAHSLVDRSSRLRLNRSASILIGDHVWIGLGALINKGCEIPEDCVVGAKSFVNKAFSESGVVIAGTPAKIVRRDVTWHRGRHESFPRGKLNAWRALGTKTSQQKME